MFRSTEIERLAEAQATSLNMLAGLETRLNRHFHGLEQNIRCLVLVVASGEPMLLLGPPGTGKSLLIRTFAELAGIGGRDGAASGEGLYFEYLLTQFTEPSELFGYLNLAAFVKGEREIRREDTGMMQHAQVIFLDEVFNASSAILNALLTFMNERKFHDRGRVSPVRMQNLFAATNDRPREPALAAMFDRFVLRTTLSQVPAEPAQLAALTAIGWDITHDRPGPDRALTGLMDQARGLQSAIGDAARAGTLEIDTAHGVFTAMAKWVLELRQQGASPMSNRRLVKFARIMLINRLLEVAAGRSGPEIDHDDLGVILRFGLDRSDTGVEAKLEQDTEFLMP